MKEISKLLKARATKEQAQTDLEANIVEIVTEFARLMDLKAPISEEKAKEN